MLRDRSVVYETKSSKTFGRATGFSSYWKIFFFTRVFFFFLLKFKIRICIRVCIYRLFSDSARPYFIGIIVYRSCQSSSGRNKRPISHKTVTTCWFEMTRFDRESRSRKIKIRSLASLVYIIQNDAIWSRISNS